MNPTTAKTLYRILLEVGKTVFISWRKETQKPQRRSEPSSNPQTDPELIVKYHPKKQIVCQVPRFIPCLNFLPIPRPMPTNYIKS